MTDDLELYVTTCQIRISGTSIALGIVAEPGLAALLEPLFENTALASVGGDEKDGEVVGLVTATDAMEAVVGQLEDPLDEAS